MDQSDLNHFCTKCNIFFCMSFLNVLIVLNFSNSPLNQLYNPASPLVNENC